MPALPRRKPHLCPECKTNKTTSYLGICKKCSEKRQAEFAQASKERDQMAREQWRKQFNETKFEMPDLDLDLDMLNLDLFHPPIPPEMLRRLIQLCHPDKHGGSEASNTATLFLLKLKNGS